MTVSSVYCPTCQHDRHFFALAAGAGIQCNWCGHIVHNYAERRLPSNWDSQQRKRAEKLKRQK